MIAIDELISAVFGLGDQIRYVAWGRGQDVVTVERSGLEAPSAGESDRYEELLINPALLTLTRQRGDIDCGGLRYVLVRYGSFFQLVIPYRDGHVSVAMEPIADPIAVASRIEELLAGHSG